MSSNDHFGPGVTVPDEPNNLPAPLPDTNSIASTGNKTLSEVQKSNIAKYEESVKYGFTPVAGPMVCRDDKCPYFDKCPLVRNKIENHSILEIWNKLIDQKKLYGYESQKDFYHLTDLDIFKKLKDL